MGDRGITDPLFSGPYHNDNYSAAGGLTSLVTLGGSISTSDSYGGNDYNQMTFVSYNRNLSNQYGGNTYSSRSANTYINCSHFFPISSSSSLGYDVFTVFGGDTYVNYYDHTKYDKNYPDQTGYALNDSDEVPRERSRFARVYLAESPVNTDLRQGNHFNKNQDNTPTWLYGDFKYNQVYS